MFYVKINLKELKKKTVKVQYQRLKNNCAEFYV